MFIAALFTILQWWKQPVSILQIKKLMHSEVRYLDRDHIGEKWWNQDLNSRLSGSRISALNHCTVVYGLNAVLLLWGAVL